MRRSPQRRTSGLGLVDSLFATTLLLVGLLTTASAVLSGSRLARTDAETRAITQVATQILDEIRVADFDTLVATYDGRSFPLDTRTEGASEGTADVAVTLVGTGFTRWPVYLVTVRVTVQGVTGTRVAEVATYVNESEPPGLPF